MKHVASRAPSFVLATCLAYGLTLKMEGVYFLTMSVNVYLHLHDQNVKQVVSKKHVEIKVRSFLLATCLAYCSTLKMTGVCFSEILVNIYHSAEHYSPEDHRHYQLMPSHQKSSCICECHSVGTLYSNNQAVQCSGVYFYNLFSVLVSHELSFLFISKYEYLLSLLLH